MPTATLFCVMASPLAQALMKSVSTKDIVALMVGEESAEVAGERRKTSSQAENQPKVQLELHDFSTDILKSVAFTLHEGELLGIGGLKGQGQRDSAAGSFWRLALHRHCNLCGGIGALQKSTPGNEQRRGARAGERAKEGLLFIRSILENLLLPSWNQYGFPTRMRKARQSASQVSASLSLKMAGLDEPVSGLSGGNAQKVVIGKWLLRKPRLLLLDDPTKGVDVGTKAEFYRLLARLCADGLSVLFYSSDDEELLGLCDRVLVMHDGNIRSELAGTSLTKSNLVAASLGASRESMQ